MCATAHNRQAGRRGGRSGNKDNKRITTITTFLLRYARGTSCVRTYVRCQANLAGKGSAVLGFPHGTERHVCVVVVDSGHGTTNSVRVDSEILPVSPLIPWV